MQENNILKKENMNYKVNVKELGKCKINFDFEVPIEEVKQTAEQVCLDLQQEIKIAGFRRSKVPIEIIKQKFDSVIKNRTKEKIIKDVIYSELKARKLSPVSLPIIEKLEFDSDKPFKFVASIEYHPDVKIKNYKNLKFKKEIKQITDDDVNETIKNLQKFHTRLEESKSNIVNKNNCVYVNYKAYNNTTEITELSAQNQLIDLEEQSYFPELIDNLIGMKKDETKNIKVHIPENYVIKKFAGIDISLELKVLSIKEKILPKPDDEFAKVLGYNNFEELVNKIKKELEIKAEKVAQQKMRNEILEYLVNTNEFEIADSLVEEQKNHLMKLFEQQLLNQGVSKEIIENQKISVEDKYKKEAEKQIREFYILQAIAKEENITVNENDLKNLYEKLLKDNPGREKQVEEYFKKNIEQLTGELKTDKIYKFLMEGVK